MALLFVSMKSVVPPQETHKLAAWFGEAVRAELTELQKKGSDQRYELHAGQLLSPEKSPYTIYRFTLADNTLVPEDANGTIEVEGKQFKASVVAQETSRVDVQIDWPEGLGAFIPRAILSVDDLALLRKLAEVLEAVASGMEPVSPLATAIFHPRLDRPCKVQLPASAVLDRVGGEQRAVLEQACGSEITFVWGPPGTGKTHVIAHLIAALVARGERVLLTSHTHVAVNQSIYEAVKRADPSNPDKKAGPLAQSPLEVGGRIVRIGRVTDERVPETVRLDDIVKRRAEAIQSEISQLQCKAGLLSEKRAWLKEQLVEWDRLQDLRRRFADAKQQLTKAIALEKSRQSEHVRSYEEVKEHNERLVKANQAWLFRSRRVQQAQEALAAAELGYAKAAKAANQALASIHDAKRKAQSVRVEAKIQVDICARLPPSEILKQQITPVEAELNQLEGRLSELKASLDGLEKEIIGNARVVAATLTKCYVGNELDSQSFDAVIVDEISMALPPLLFVAGGRARRRVILVGDFKQLPPIVRSDSEVADERLRQDAFHLARVADGLEPTQHPALARLRTQRRMLPGIANAARHISYTASGLVDHEEVLKKHRPLWLKFLPENALVVVDTADLHCWCGRQAGSLSRFNFYSAQISAELAAMAAATIPRSVSTDSPQIGIVTPYAAQRRFVSRLIQDLTPRVAAGTIHTFRGREAELIIFDSVLDEPYWTARLCNPNESKEVKRDLNVALTRAKSTFVLVGSSEWLNRHAKPACGLGQLWHYMKDHADLVSAYDLVEAKFAGRVAGDHGAGYRDPVHGVSVVQEILNENTFFERFAADLRHASESVLGLVPFFGGYRWPKVEPHLRAALERGVEVTLITPPPGEAQNKSYVEEVIRSLRQLGAIVVSATGLHGKDIVIDSRILYTGSLNWASHRGRAEVMHRIENAKYARTVLEYLQARHIRSASQQGKQPRACPKCHGPTQVVNQARPMSQWDKQPMKLGCADYQSTGCKYLVDIDQRPRSLNLRGVLSINARNTVVLGEGGEKCGNVQSIQECVSASRLCKATPKGATNWMEKSGNVEMVSETTDAANRSAGPGPRNGPQCGFSGRLPPSQPVPQEVSSTSLAGILRVVIADNCITRPVRRWMQPS